jgi:hypothetical protein
MTISVETGLPELPKDEMFWRVVEKNDMAGFGIFGNGPTAYVQLVERIRITKMVPNVLFTLFGKWKFEYGERPEANEHDYVHVSSAVYKYDIVTEDFYDDSDTKIGVKDVRKGRRISGDDLTPELILSHAEDALKRYHEINKSRGYLGDYPPKNIYS